MSIILWGGEPDASVLEADLIFGRSARGAGKNFVKRAKIAIIL